MLFKNKGIPDATVLRLVSKILKKGEVSKGYRVSTVGGKKTVTIEEITGFVDALATRLEDGRYGVIRRCDTCGNFSQSGKVGKRGWCSPKNLSSFRDTTEYCSRWIPMTPEQKRIRGRVNEHFRAVQTKRAGNGSENSNKSH